MNISSCTPCDMSDTENTTAGCLSRLFCTCNNLPSQPRHSDKQVENQVELDHPKSLGTEKAARVFVSPGIVARLMGLESMPDPKETSHVDSVRRSRSASSVDCLSEFDPIQGFHRRVRTSWSFHDIPTFLQIDDSEGLLVRSGNASEKKAVGSKERKSKMTKREGVAQRKEKQVCRKIVSSEHRHRRKSNASSSPTENGRKVNYGCSVPSPRNRIDFRKAVGVSREKIPSELAIHREMPTKEKARRISLKKSRPAECRSENIRIIQPKTYLPAKEGWKSRRRITNSRKQEPLEILNSKVSSRKYSNYNLKQEEARRSNQCDKSSKSVCYLKLRGDVCRLVEGDMKSLEWKPIEMWKLVHVEEIGIKLGHGIFNRLLHEVVAELCGFPMENLGLLLMEEYL